ncbi:MAG: plasmid stabilization protein [Opitutus sp.]|nr:plasmid stabilization protein [Opitutus sp.]
MKPFAFHPEADTEFIATLERYAAISAELGDRFYDEVHRLIGEAGAMPKIFRIIYPPARRVLAQDFPFGIIYVDQPDRIWILALMHLHRAPDYWKHRLPVA